MFAICSLPLLAFTSPERSGPVSFTGLDWLAIVKAFVLVSVLLATTVGLLSSLGQRSSRLVLSSFLPFFIFLAWALVSVLWSPLRAVSLGQAGGLCCLLLLASLVAVTASRCDNVERTLTCVSLVLISFSTTIIVFHVLRPDLSGMDRRMLVDGKEGIVHATAAGASASLGLLVCSLCYFVGRFRYSLVLLTLGLVTHGTVAITASSRMALLMLAVTVPVVVFLYIGNAARALLMSIAAMLLITLVMFDPGFHTFLSPNSTSVQYVTRGQTADQLRAISGREEMWSKIWAECRKSMVVGHGYFVTCETGELEVWGMKTNHTAHNLVLQVLAGTGLVGIALFLIALARPYLQFYRLLQFRGEARIVGVMLFFITLWFFGWSMLASSFMGPVRPESVVFFVFLGLGVGQLVRINTIANSKKVDQVACG